ncbi:hypothetical protein [Stieleria varia]|uniref:Secreted protein n=1 Tax=Stieleria varia TaxID=2528005 RepID=A0A5C6B9V6_9BACT|nr:hypothetical protein [Stieleria varia]TWU08221.1 hypothetical protein Pla52n_08030 [Stieleria varia]
MKYSIALLFSIVAAASITAARSHATDDGNEPNANKTVDEWTFPHGSGGGIQTIGIGDGPIQTSIIDTKKTFGEVWTFYAKKIGSDKKYAEETAHYDHGKTIDGRYFIRDFIKTDEPRRTFFVYTCSRFTVTAIVKPKGDGTIVDMTVVAHE